MMMDRESLSEWAKDKPLSILQLDPADRAVLRIADERDAIQKKTFTKWVNKHLKKASRRVDDLFEDLRDGHNLLSLLEVLSGEHLPREKGKMRFHMLQNAQMALDFLRYKKIKLVNIRAEDIVDGNPKLTLGLIWTIILHFQISDIVVGQDDNVTAREALLRWARRSTARYPGVRVNDFTGSWRDGLAFSALVHRNRPDLLDWRKARSARPRERLETAFHVVEKEYGVTRLLDPEDVDTNEPDEKSMITYLSSLYDVFPEPPSLHPLYDMDSQQRVHEYKDLAHQLLYWCREKTSLLQERSFPPTLIELKRLYNDLNRFRNEEVPPRQRDKQNLFKVYKELEKYFESVGEVEVETDLRPESLEKAWHQLQSAIVDRDTILQQEIQRLERLQRLADKVQREIKRTDSRITDLEQRISEEARRIERVHPIDAKNICEALETEIRQLEAPIQEMSEDCLVLKDGRYPQASELQKKVTKLHQRWSQLRASFHTNLVHKLSGLRYPVTESTITKQTRTVIEARQIDTNPYFRDLQEYTEWCQNKLKELLAADYGSDLPSVKAELERHQQEHRVIDKFHAKVVHAERQQVNFSGDELNLYQQRLSQLQKVYAELLSTSNKRLSDLDALQNFLQAASAELQWLNDREQVEIQRDWAAKDLDLPGIHRYYENLMSELEKRELHFASILDRGEALLLQQHPAAKCIEAHLQALQSQWSWLLQLTLCLEVHLKHATEYHNFYSEVKDAEAWLTKRDEILNSKYSQSNFGLDEGEQLLRGMQDLREELNVFGETVSQLQQRAQTIVPLKQRKQPVNRLTPVQAICAYKQGNISLEKGENCTLIDTSGRVKWRVRANGAEGPVPGACLLLPPPDQEAIDAADRLKRLFDRTVALWQKKQLRLRQNMIFATIKVVKGWDFDQFLAMGADQRNAIRRALNDDADKLLSEGDPADPQLRRLRREMDEVNKLFDDFEKRSRAEEESKQATRIFTEECISLKNKLEDMARELDHIILSPLPRDLDSLEHAVQIHEDYRRRLQHLEPDLKHLQETFRTIALKTPQLKKSLDNLVELWKELNTQSNLHGDRLKLLEGALVGLEENEQVISDLEGALAKQLEMPSTLDGLQNVLKNLNKLQEIVTQQQPQIDKMNDSADQLGRMGVPTKVINDLKRLHANVERLNVRWNNVRAQLTDRLVGCENAIGIMTKLQTSLANEETWVDGATEKLQALPTGTLPLELDDLLGKAVERTPKIEQVNLNGGRLLREAKIYDTKCLHYTDWLVETRPSFSPPRRDLRPPGQDPGANEAYTERLDALNAKFQRLLEQLTQRLKTAIEVSGADGLRYAESLHEPLRTYRSEFVVGNTPHENSNEDVYTTSYSTSQFTTTRTSTVHTDVRRQFSDTTDNGNTIIEPRDNILNTPGVIDPNSGRVLTIGEAIQSRILDVRTGGIIVNQERISLEEAIKRKLIDAQLANSLLQPGAAIHAGKPISLLEVIQREISEAENGYDSTEKRIKVITTTTTSSRNANDDDDRGGASYSVHSESVKIKPNELCLSDAIVHGLIDTSGWVMDRNSGDKFRLDSAIAKSLITPHVREVVDAKNDVKITLQQALDSGILNAKTGRYIQNVTKEKLTFNESKNRQLIGKTMTLKDVCDLNLLEKNGTIISPTRRNKLNILSAIDVGVLDSDTIKSVTKTKDERVTLAQALAEGIILPESKYRDAITQEEMSIPDAVERGLISSVSQRSIFNIDGFKDPYSTDFVSLNVALNKNLLRKKDGQYQLDTGKGHLIPLSEALDKGLVRPEFYDMINRPIGVFDATGKELTVLDLVYYDLIDPKSGFLLDPKTKAIVPLDHAIESKLITPEGALLLSSLLNITLTTETVTKTIRRYVTITDDEDDPKAQVETVPTFTEAVRLGYIDEKQQLFTDPNTGKIYSIQQALNHRFILPDSTSVHIPKPVASTVSVVHKSIEPEQLTQKVQRTKTIHQVPIRSVDSPSKEYSTFHTETKVEKKFDTKTITTDFLTVEQKVIPMQATEQFLEIPPEGWTLSTAIENRLFDPMTGLFHITATDRLVSFEECIKLEIIKPDSVSVIDSTNGRKITVKRSFEKRILDGVGNYKKNNKMIGMKQAIDSGLIILEDGSSPSIDKSYTPFGAKTPSRTQSQDIPSPEPVQLVPGVIYDPSTALVIFTESGQSETIVTAVEKGLVDSNMVKIIDPKTGTPLTVKEAIERNVIDRHTGQINDASNKKIDLISAAKFGLLAVIGSPLVAVAGAMESLKFFTDPKTGQQIPYELAYERGLITREELLAASPSHSPSHTVAETKFTVSFGSATASPERESKPIILQKMRKKIVSPKDAVAKGIIDAKTAATLDSKQVFLDENGDVQTLSDVVKADKIEGNSGAIVDPQRGDVLTINKAIERGILDSEGTNQILVPLNKSLSIAQLKEQGRREYRRQRYGPVKLFSKDAAPLPAVKVFC